MLIKLALAPVLSLQLPNPAGAIFVGLLLVGGCFLCAAVARAWQGRGDKKEGEK